MSEWIKDLALLQLLCRIAAGARILSLTHQHFHMQRLWPKKKKKKKKRIENYEIRKEEFQPIKILKKTYNH